MWYNICINRVGSDTRREKAVIHRVLVACSDKDCQDSMLQMLSTDLFDVHFLSDKEDMLLELLERDYELLVYGLQPDDYAALKIIKIIKLLSAFINETIKKSPSPNLLFRQILYTITYYNKYWGNIL